MASMHVSCKNIRQGSIVCLSSSKALLYTLTHMQFHTAVSMTGNQMLSESSAQCAPLLNIYEC